MKRVLFILTVLLSACGGPQGDVVVLDGQNVGLVRFYDKEAGVVCWSRINSYQSLACLPIEQTKLKLPKEGR
jgi:hypothetical protein